MVFLDGGAESSGDMDVEGSDCIALPSSLCVVLLKGCFFLSAVCLLV